MFECGRVGLGRLYATFALGGQSDPANWPTVSGRPCESGRREAAARVRFVIHRMRAATRVGLAHQIRRDDFFDLTVWAALLGPIRHRATVVERGVQAREHLA